MNLAIETVRAILDGVVNDEPDTLTSYLRALAFIVCAEAAEEGQVPELSEWVEGLGNG